MTFTEILGKAAMLIGTGMCILSIGALTTQMPVLWAGALVSGGILMVLGHKFVMSDE